MVDLKDEKVQLKALENLFTQKRFSEALAMAEKLNSDFPDSYYINILYVKILMELNRVTEAEETAKGLLQLYPDNINLLQEMGNIYLKLNKYDESLEYYNKILFLDPFNALAKESIEKIEALRKTVESRGKKSADFVSYQNEKMIARQDTVPEDQLPDTKTNGEPGPEIPVEPPTASGKEHPKPPPIPEIEKIPETKEEMEFVTESAAELYLSQGLYEDALKIYEKLYAARKEERFMLKIKQLKTHIISQEKIERLTDFWKLIQKRGEKIV